MALIYSVQIFQLAGSMQVKLFHLQNQVYCLLWEVPLCTGQIHSNWENGNSAVKADSTGLITISILQPTFMRRYQACRLDLVHMHKQSNTTA